MSFNISRLSSLESARPRSSSVVVSRTCSRETLRRAPCHQHPYLRRHAPTLLAGDELCLFLNLESPAPEADALSHRVRALSDQLPVKGRLTAQTTSMHQPKKDPSQPTTSPPPQLPRPQLSPPQLPTKGRHLRWPLHLNGPSAPRQHG